MSKFHEIKDAELISIYGDIVKELRSRNIIRTRNVVGDLGEGFVVDFYTRSPDLEDLSLAPPSTKSIDAVAKSGNRYAIKSITRNLTGVFYGLPHKDSIESPVQLFDFLIVVLFSDSYEVRAVYQLTWNQFIAHKRWHSRMKAWNVSINQKIKDEAITVYKAK